MRRLATATLSIALVAGLATPSQAVVHRRDIVSITVSPAAPVPRGFSVPLTVDALLRNGQHVDITRRVRWTSSSTVVQLSRRGRARQWVTGRQAGQATVTAAWGNLSATHVVTVTNATLVAVGIVPAPLALQVGQPQALSAVGTFSDGSSLDITRWSVWSSGDPFILRMSGSTAVGVADGRVQVLVLSRSVLGTATATVGTPD